MSGRFELVDHTGDLGVRVFGGSLPQLFEQAAQALSSILTDPETIRISETRKFLLEAKTDEELLITWLNELVYLFDTEGLLFKNYNVLSVHDHHLEALAQGESYDEGRHPIKTTVKAATYHQLKIENRQGVWTAQVIFDL
ncbi:MAG: archease [Desulfobacterota bacterium]|jgi:SHS2 domain-containing protein|nr:archease [Thermodesulfobacteriota bacterium]